MNVLETEWWVVAVPGEWWADQEDEMILIGDRDEVGCIEISTLKKHSGHFTEQEVREVADSDREVLMSWEAIGFNGFEGIYGTYCEEGASLREWYVFQNDLLLFISYSCDSENEGMDDAAVDQIINTIELIEHEDD